jgi:leucyl aminopeptidase
MEGVLLANYRCKRSKPRRRPPLSGRCTLVGDVDDAAIGAARTSALATAAGIVLARDLVNAPAAELGPDELAGAAAALAKEHGFECEVIRGADVARRGFRMVAAVGRGSARPPTVTVLRRGDVAAKGALALIGKGVVFDSGGLDSSRPTGCC